MKVSKALLGLALGILSTSASTLACDNPPCAWGQTACAAFAPDNKNHKPVPGDTRLGECASMVCSAKSERAHIADETTGKSPSIMSNIAGSALSSGICTQYNFEDDMLACPDRFQGVKKGAKLQAGSICTPDEKNAGNVPVRNQTAALLAEMALSNPDEKLKELYVEALMKLEGRSNRLPPHGIAIGEKSLPWLDDGKYLRRIPRNMHQRNQRLHSDPLLQVPNDENKGQIAL